MDTGDRFIDAAKTGDSGLVAELLERDASLGSYRAASGETPLMAALYRGHRAIVDQLLDAGVPLDLFAAAAVGRRDGVRAELDASPGSIDAVAYDGWTALHLAAFFGQRSIVEELLDRGAAIGAVSRNSLRNTALHAALAGGHTDVALLLLERGAPVEARDAGDHTPLHIAAESGMVSLVKTLLERGADPLAVDAEDKTPLSRAAARNHTEVVDAINVDR
jgi:uncharacterized protein